MQKFLLCIALVTALFLHMPQKTLAFDFVGEYTFCTTQNICDDNCNVVQCGNLFFVTCDSSYADKLKIDKNKLVGQSVSFCGDEQAFFDVCKSLGKTKSFYKTEGIFVAEGFCQQLTGCVSSKNKKTNFQVCFDGKRITVGTPLILTGF